MRTALLAASVLVLAACGDPADSTATASTETPAAPLESATTPANSAFLPERLDCLRQSGGVLLIGHRGGPTRDYPENAIETFQRTYDAGTRAMEIDIAETKDGHLILIHDDELERTTTGEGLVSDHTLAEIRALKLETYSKTTDFSPPTLEEALAWAVHNNALVELDKKRSASYGPIIAAVRAAKAENHVFVMTYNDDQAVEVHALAPDLVITATIETLDHADRLIARGVKPRTLVAWTGASQPNSELWQGLAARGIESAFGTLGPRSSSLDTRYWEDDDGAEYNALVYGGLPILVTDITDKTARQLRAFTSKAADCGL